MLVYSGDNLNLLGYTNSDFKSDKDARKSTSDSVFTLRGIDLRGMSHLFQGKWEIVRMMPRKETGFVILNLLINKIKEICHELFETLFYL